MWRFVFFGLLISQTVYAFRLNPMSATIELSQNEKHYSFLVENNTKSPVAVQINLHTRDMNDLGEDKLGEVKDLVAFPDQLIIPPEQSRTVKVTFTGDPKKVDQELSYRFVAEQLPIDLQKKTQKSGVKMLLKYVAALYVNPEDSQAKINCVLKNLKLHCKNEGNKHQIVLFKSLSFGEKKKKITLSKEELKKVSGENILAGKERVFDLSFKNELKNLKETKADFKLEE